MGERKFRYSYPYLNLQNLPKLTFLKLTKNTQFVLVDRMLVKISWTVINHLLETRFEIDSLKIYPNRCEHDQSYVHICYESLQSSNYLESPRRFYKTYSISGLAIVAIENVFARKYDRINIEI